MAHTSLPRRWTSRLPTLARNDRQSAPRQRQDRSLQPVSYLVLLVVLCLAACGGASTQPVVKIGLVAPFEGRYRSIGYEAIYAARLAIREINAKGGINGQRVELVALDDGGEPDKAIEAARQLVIDPQVVAVIGHLRPDSTAAALKIYCDAGLPVIVIESAPAACNSAFVTGVALRDRWIDDRLIFVSNVPDPNGLTAAQDFVAKYNTIPIDGTRAGPIALQTYDVMSLLFEAFDRAPQIDRGGVKAVLTQRQFSGLGETYAFDQQGQLIEPKTYVFEYDKARQPHLIP
jgi:ABC-type branched-subunit amino acid transport system substrate-binding protein